MGYMMGNRKKPMLLPVSHARGGRSMAGFQAAPSGEKEGRILGPEDLYLDKRAH
jgi:hypothetical protein